jgi:hypothetical protein
LLDILLKEKKEAPASPRPKLAIVTDSHSPRNAAHANYVRKGFELELKELRTVAPGSQNEELNRSAFNIGTLVGTGYLTREEAEHELVSVVLGWPNQADKKPWTERNAMPTINSGLDKGIRKPRTLPEPKRNVLLRGREARAYIRGAKALEPDNDDESEPAIDEDERVADEGVYAILNGRTVLATSKAKQKETGQEENTTRHFVCDWSCEIVSEVRDEEGRTIFDIEGRTIGGREFSMSLPAAKLSDSRFVAGEFLNVVGVSPVLFAGMEKHLVPSMRSFSNMKTAKRIRRYNRVGWTRESEKDLSKREFIIPGMLPPDVDVTGLDNHLAYRVDPPKEPELSKEAAEALQALILSQEPKHTLIALTTAFAAPLSLLCGWQGDKYAVFIAGRTGSFKTSFCQMLLCLYGDFEKEDTLIKFGLGTTANSLQAILTRASNMPVLIDNYKTNTGKGGQDAVSMIQAALEGGEKIRLNRNSEIRQTKPINAWLFLTGEDYVEDAASRARSLYLPFAFFGDTNESLSRVQELAHALPQIGGHIISWALSDEALIVADYVKDRFGKRRSHWAEFIRKQNKDAVNAYRVASNLAVCECAWEMIMGCPAMASHLRPFAEQFKEGLLECARSMAFLTAETHEATRYLDSLREMIASDRAYLCPRGGEPSLEERRLKLGWHDDKGVYLIPGVAFEAAVKAMASQGGLNSMSKNALHKQLAQLNHLEKHKKDQFTTTVRVGDGTVQTVLHLKREAFFGVDDELL